MKPARGGRRGWIAGGGRARRGRGGRGSCGRARGFGGQSLKDEDFAFGKSEKYFKYLLQLLFYLYVLLSPFPLKISRLSKLQKSKNLENNWPLLAFYSKTNLV